MHDEQAILSGLTERRRTIVKFLGHESKMTIDYTDTWAQKGDMRSLWKGTTKFWTHVRCLCGVLFGVWRVVCCVLRGVWCLMSAVCLLFGGCVHVCGWCVGALVC